jgi:hypothetical protein
MASWAKTWDGWSSHLVTLVQSSTLDDTEIVRDVTSLRTIESGELFSGMLLKISMANMSNT